MAFIHHPLFAALFILMAYLLGSISFAVVVSKCYGLEDPRSYGSGNPGATNVLRSGNKIAAILTLIGDAFKGWLAVWLALQLNFAPTVLALTAIAVFLGHLFPIFLSFKGGKGVATALGVLIGLAPALGVATLLTWLIVAVFFRLSSLAAIAAGLFAPFYYFILSGLLWPFNPEILWATVVIALLLIQRHHANISRILNGTEPKIGQKSADKANSTKT
ncbi:MAG: glycerol-3-phosphate 1-O-acyltransferase PlsY [Orrella sp.]